MRRFLSVVFLSLPILLGVRTVSASEENFPQGPRQFGCALAVDPFGEREVSNVYFYPTVGGIVYWDEHFRAWIGPYGWWTPSGSYHPGFFLHGYRDLYRASYRPYRLSHSHGGRPCK
jgi:hypothetical protein